MNQLAAVKATVLDHLRWLYREHNGGASEALGEIAEQCGYGERLTLEALQALIADGKVEMHGVFAYSACGGRIVFDD